MPSELGYWSNEEPVAVSKSDARVVFEPSGHQQANLRLEKIKEAPLCNASL
jgi:hypothetical protein